jgi:Transposase domain (DUF772)
LLLQASYSVRSERQLMEQLEYNLLFRWFVGLSLDDEIWDVTVFTKNRERLTEGDIATQFMAAVLDQEAVKHCCRTIISRRGVPVTSPASPFSRGRRVCLQNFPDIHLPTK